MSATLRHRFLPALAASLCMLYLATLLWHLYKPLPEGVGVAYPARAAEQTRFLVDSTWLDDRGQQHQDTEIFEAFFDLIDRAERLIVLEMFLINQFAGQSGDGHRALSTEVFDRLLARRQAAPDIRIILIIDPFNRLYGGVESPQLDALESAGIEVIETDLGVLRDSNPMWSAAWRICCQWFGNSPGGSLPNPVGGESVSLRTWLALLNFKANHRKALVADQDGRLHGWVSSGNAHDASSRHSNVGLTFSGAAAIDLLDSMRATAEMAGKPQDWLGDSFDASVNPSVNPSIDRTRSHSFDQPADEDSHRARLQVLTEAAIRDAALARIRQATAGDRLDLAMFYLAHRALITELVLAHQRGVRLRVLLDPNEDAFGRKKDGVPNRQVARELERAGIAVRWCNTRGEQCHYKHLLHQQADSGRVWLLLGSSNFTRRNLDNYNLETQVLLQSDADHPAARGALDFFDQRWSNPDDRRYSLPYSAYADDSLLRYWRYRLMEFSGLSTF